MADQLKSIGFSEPRQEVPLDLILQDASYFYADGILDPDWRSGDSIWSLVEDKTLTDVLEKTQNLQKSGKLENFMLKHDQPRKTSGQVTFTVAGKQL